MAINAKNDVQVGNPWKVSNIIIRCGIKIRSRSLDGDEDLEEGLPIFETSQILRGPQEHLSAAIHFLKSLLHAKFRDNGASKRW